MFLWHLMVSYNDSPLNIWVETALSFHVCLKSYNQMQCFYARKYINFMLRDTEQHDNYQLKIYVELPVCVRSSGWFPNNLTHSSSSWGQNMCVWVFICEAQYSAWYLTCYAKATVVIINTENSVCWTSIWCGWSQTRYYVIHSILDIDWVELVFGWFEPRLHVYINMGIVKCAFLTKCSICYGNISSNLNLL